jgi:diketogulonate reductase-like aldo/keto reductase
MQLSRAQDAIDPATVPSHAVGDGASMPAVGLGTFGSDHVSPAGVAAAVREAIALGYRHIDCASVYGNEAEIGEVLREVLGSGLVRREELWITSKLWNDKHAPGDVVPQAKKSLADLQLDYLDLYLVHWPFPNHHPPGCDVGARSPDARPYIHEDFMATWRSMESLVDLGLARHIGTSNMTIPKLELLLRDARVKPACNEMELHPHFQQPELFAFCRARGILPVGYCPVGSPARPERDRTETDTVDLEDPVIREIAANHGIHPAVACIKWAVQRGQVPIPFSTKRSHLAENLRCATTPPFNAGEMEAIGESDRNCRLIKGHVFLWKDGQTWEALWDTDGVVTPP